MKDRIFSVALWLAAMSLPFASAAMAAGNLRQITVTGTGSVATVPDMAMINLGVSNRAKQAADAMAATSETTAKMLQQLAALGIEPADMQTSNLSLNPVWSNRSSSGSGVRPGPGDREILGFVASNSVLVRVRDLHALGQIMAAVTSVGANNFNGLQFSLQDPEPLANLARQKAVADAIAKASLFAMAADVPLGAVQSITEQGGARPMAMEMPVARGAAMPIAAGEVSVAASVVMVFAIGD
ncbi:MAG: hypothetical protein COC12_14635 [Rhodobacteraceae bacterium]|nr:MAG: hypothetical protein COC12_14635 [Paracoccaceae bacterium]